MVKTSSTMETEGTEVDSRGFGDVISRIKKVHGILDRVGTDISNIKTRVRHHQRSQSSTTPKKLDNRNFEHSAKDDGPDVARARQRSHIPVPIGRLRRQRKSSPILSDMRETNSLTFGKSNAVAGKALNRTGCDRSIEQAKKQYAGGTGEKTHPHVRLDNNHRSIKSFTLQSRSRMPDETNLPRQRPSFIPRLALRKSPRTPEDQKSSQRSPKAMARQSRLPCPKVTLQRGKIESTKFNKEIEVSSAASLPRIASDENKISQSTSSESGDDSATPTNSPRRPSLKVFTRTTENEERLQVYLNKKSEEHLRNNVVDESFPSGRRILIAKRSKSVTPRFTKTNSSPRVSATSPKKRTTVAKRLAKSTGNTPTMAAISKRQQEYFSRFNTPKPIRGRGHIANTTNETSPVHCTTDFFDVFSPNINAYEPEISTASVADLKSDRFSPDQDRTDNNGNVFLQKNHTLTQDIFAPSSHTVVTVTDRHNDTSRWPWMEMDAPQAVCDSDYESSLEKRRNFHKSADFTSANVESTILHSSKAEETGSTSGYNTDNNSVVDSHTSYYESDGRDDPDDGRELAIQLTAQARHNETDASRAENEFNLTEVNCSREDTTKGLIFRPNYYETGGRSDSEDESELANANYSHGHDAQRTMVQAACNEHDVYNETRDESEEMKGEYVREEEIKRSISQATYHDLFRSNSDDNGNLTMELGYFRRDDTRQTMTPESHAANDASGERKNVHESTEAEHLREDENIRSLLEARYRESNVPNQPEGDSESARADHSQGIDVQNLLVQENVGGDEEEDVCTLAHAGSLQNVDTQLNLAAPTSHCNSDWHHEPEEDWSESTDTESSAGGDTQRSVVQASCNENVKRSESEDGHELIDAKHSLKNVIQHFTIENSDHENGSRDESENMHQSTDKKNLPLDETKFSSLRKRLRRYTPDPAICKLNRSLPDKFVISPESGEKFRQRIHHFENLILDDGETTFSPVPSIFSDIERLINGYIVETCMSLEKDPSIPGTFSPWKMGLPMIPSLDLRLLSEAKSRLRCIKQEAPNYLRAAASIGERTQAWLGGEIGVIQCRQRIAEIKRCFLSSIENVNISHIRTIVYSLISEIKRSWQNCAGVRRGVGKITWMALCKIFHGITTLCVMAIIFALAISEPDKEDFLRTSEIFLENIITFERVGSHDCIV